MKAIKVAAAGLLAVATGLAATPVQASELRVTVDTFKNGEMIPNKYAFCAPAAQGHTAPGDNFSPSISWSRGPRGTKSYAILLYDTDSPAEQRDKINKEGVTMTSAIPRRTFFHWVLVDIPPNIRSLKEGADSSARVVHGKPATPAAVGVRGLNDYTKVTAGNDATKGQYYGYDGPCPPWNDEVVHHYHFAVFALSAKKLDLPQDFDGAAVLEVIKDKVLAQGEVVGLYTQNPAAGAKISN
ncbi:MAG TPA: YbhB/YbcL family Raf kinase inhibitor-like protein [Xanthobacteraceae bacterium]|nr:YbhB/YbcL family Raf kinase inhibitor-like protein [Xanthobacteraceae bacterium]